jgi:phosphoribosylanthranilate isomerase
MKGAIKICGITTAETFDCAVSAGATHIGFAFIARSPRHILPASASALAARSTAVSTVALVMDASDADIEAILAAFRPTLIQVHGKETPERIAEMRNRFALPVMKAIGIGSPSDLLKARAYEGVADMLLFDAAPAELPGGNGTSFDWPLVAGQKWKCPWLLSGGLTPANVGDAIYQTRPDGVDVSSGVESARGVKDYARIAAFISGARTAFSGIADA